MKKNTLFPRLAAALLLLLAAPPLLCDAVFNNMIQYQAKYNGTPVFGTDTLGGVTYATISYGDLTNGGAPGMPCLPIDYLRFSVPYNATDFRVSATKLMNQSHYIDHLLFPCQTPRMMNDTTPLVVTLPDTAAYYSGTSFPTAAAWVVDEGFLDGENHIVTVAVMPFSYRHTDTTDVISQARRVSLMLRYSLSDSLNIYPIVRNDSLLRGEGYQLAQSMVVNPNQVKNFSVGYNYIEHIDSMGINPNGFGGDGLNDFEPPTPIQDSTEIITYTRSFPYLIVTTSDLYHSVRRIAALKRQKGYNVKVVTMDQVMNNPLSYMGDRMKKADGTYHIAYSDSAGVLRQFLKLFYKLYGTKYVLLAGNGVPYRTISLNSGVDNKVRIVQSDLYFCDLNADWSTDTIEKTPELFVGRILANSFDQISNYTDKLYRYELNPGKGNPTYLKRALYSQSYDMRRWHEVDTIKKALEYIYPNPTILSESSNINDTSKFPSGADIISEINNTQYGFLSLHHHGYPSALLTYGLRSYGNNPHKDKYLFLRSLENYRFVDTNYRDDDTLSFNGLDNMTNKWYPNICYTIACKSMPFTVWPKYEDLPMNFGESFTTGKDYGGPLFIGNTNNGVTYSSAMLERQVAKEVVNGRYILGEANGYGKLFFKDVNLKTINYVPTVQNLLGDPSLEIWTDIPQLFSNISVSYSGNSIHIIGDTISNSLRGAHVAYIDNQGHQGIDSISSSSITLNNVSPNSCVMFFKHNYIPYIMPLKLQNINICNSQYVIASDVTIGKMIDSYRTYGDVIVKNKTNYEIEASGEVRLESGFIVEPGASFAVYPSCF